MINTYVNEIDDKWFLSFGSPAINYKGELVEVSEEVAKSILSMVE